MRWLRKIIDGNRDLIFINESIDKIKKDLGALKENIQQHRVEYFEQNKVKLNQLGLYPKVEEIIDIKFNNKRKSVSKKFENEITNLEKLLKEDKNQSKQNIFKSLYETEEKLEGIVRHTEKWGELPEYFFSERDCIYGPSETNSRKEKNCFQDFVTNKFLQNQKIDDQIKNDRSL